MARAARALAIAVIFFAISVPKTLAANYGGRCSGLNHQILNRSYKLGIQFLLRNQKKAGNFHYEYDWKTHKDSADDNQVRQAGVTWGLALIYQDTGRQDVANALLRALDFFRKASRQTATGSRYIAYPGDRTGKLGVVSLIALSYMDYLQRAKLTLETNTLKQLETEMNQYIDFLVEARTNRGLFHGSYSIRNGEPYGKPSPYSDGESLLALVKAAKYHGRKDLLPLVMDSAREGLRVNIMEALKKSPDSRITKGYYQWISMAFYEMFTAGWSGARAYGRVIIKLADWMIDVHKTLERTRNTAYAYEGIIPALVVAKQLKDVEHARKFACVIDQGLRKLTSWQVGGPIPDKYVKSTPTDDKRAIGGVQNHPRESPLRIDVTQHQMHAVSLALKYIYRRNSGDSIISVNRP